MRKISLAGGEAAEGCGDKKAKDATESHFYRVMPHSTKSYRDHDIVRETSPLGL
jgi:hypothetical protein